MNAGKGTPRKARRREICGEESRGRLGCPRISFGIRMANGINVECVLGGGVFGDSLRRLGFVARIT
jgi:hypothetical protein